MSEWQTSKRDIFMACLRTSRWKFMWPALLYSPHSRQYKTFEGQLVSMAVLTNPAVSATTKWN